MRIFPTCHVLVIAEDPKISDRIASSLLARSFEVFSCEGLAHAGDVLEHWRPHVLVLVPANEAERHHALETLRHSYPSIPVVVLTEGNGQDLLLDLEAFAPALPVPPSMDMTRLASAVADAAALS